MSKKQFNTAGKVQSSALSQQNYNKSRVGHQSELYGDGKIYNGGSGNQEQNYDKRNEINKMQNEKREKINVNINNFATNMSTPNASSNANKQIKNAHHKTVWESQSHNKSRSPNRSRPVQNNRVQQKCVICKNPTEKCCSLCKKAYYCSAQCQQIDWNTEHRFTCEGKNVQKSNFQSNNSNFVFYNQNDQKNIDQNIKSQNQQNSQQAIQYFFQIIQQRLVLRAKIMNQISKLTDRTPSIVRQSLVKQTEQLLQLSERITFKQYKSSFNRTNQNIIGSFSSEHWGTEVVISDMMIGLEYICDMALMGKIYHVAGLVKETKEIVITLGKILEDPQQKYLFLESSEADSVQKQGNYNSIVTNLYSNANSQNVKQIHDPHLKTKNFILQLIIQLSQFYNIDKTTEAAYKVYIKKVEQQQGVWQQIYVYFNMGVWYMKKTYYQKSIKSFTYSIQLIDRHKKTSPESAILKADCLYNMAQANWCFEKQSSAIENMQQCYRIKVNGIGKNSIQCSFCLIKLAKWYKSLHKWSECLQYLEECLRIRKMYDDQAGYEGKKQEVQIMIVQVLNEIKREKGKSIDAMDAKAERFYQDLLAKQKAEEEKIQIRKNEEAQFLQKDSVTSRLFRDDKEYIKFKVVISQQMWDTINAEQAKHLADLIEFTDQKMEKGQAIRFLFQSEFVSSLTSEQREIFFQQNQLDKSQVLKN